MDYIAKAAQLTVCNAVIPLAAVVAYQVLIGMKTAAIPVPLTAPVVQMKLSA